VTRIGSPAWLKDLLQTDYYSRLFINDWRPNPRCSVAEVIPLHLHQCGPMSAEEETDFLRLMKIPNHVRSYTATSHADTGSCYWLALTLVASNSSSSSSRH